MFISKRAGLVVGAMLLLQLALLIVPFVLLHPLMSSEYFTNAAEYSFQIKTAVLLLFLNGALTIGISIRAWPVFRRYSEPMAMWLIVLAVILFVLQAVDNVHIMSMLSFSELYRDSAGSDEQMRIIATVVRMTRRWAHYPELFAIDFWILMFQSILLRFKLVSVSLVAFSLLTTVVHFVAVPLPGFLGYGINTTFGAAMALGLLLIALWLIVKDFKDQPQPGPDHTLN